MKVIYGSDTESGRLEREFPDGVFVRPGEGWTDPPVLQNDPRLVGEEYIFKGRMVRINPLALIDAGIDAEPKEVFCFRSMVCRPIGKTVERRGSVVKKGLEWLRYGGIGFVIRRMILG